MKTLKILAPPIVWLLLLVAFPACEEVIEWDLQAGENGQLVVEGILTDERKRQEIRLSLSYDALNGIAPPVTDAEVWVTVNGVILPFRHDDRQPGSYRSEAPFAVIDDLEYRLQITWRGQQYTAASELAAVAPMPLITFLDLGRPDSLTFGEFAPVYHPDQQAMYEMEVDWAHLGAAAPTRARLYFYTFSSIDISGLVRPARDTVFFPRGSRVIAKKYGLDAAFADYLRAMVIETDWRGGVFFSAAATPPTNLSNGALGFFSTCSVVMDTLVAR